MDYSKEYTEAFLTAYRKLEQLRNDDAARYSRFKKQYADQFELFRTTRNTLTHDVLKGSYPYIVSKALADSLNHMLYLMTVKCSEIATKREQVITADRDASMKDVLLKMRTKGLSYLPVLAENDAVSHVVSAKAVLSILCDGIYDPEKPLKDYLDYFTLENPYETYFFCAESTYATKAKDIFENALVRKKCHIAFVTRQGQPDEPLYGVLTPWDVFSLEAE